MTSAQQPPAGRLGRLGAWCARHFVLVVVCWLLALAGLHVLQNTVGGTYSDDFNLPGTQSDTGLNLLKTHAPASGGTSAQVVLNDAQAPLSAVSGQTGQVVANLQHLPHVLSAAGPTVSQSGHIGYLTVHFDTNPTSLGKSYLNEVDAAVAPLRNASVEVEYGGPLGELARPKATDLASEAIGFGVAVVVLLIGFGSVIAAGLPLVSALVSVIVGLSCLSLLAIAFTFATVSPTLATMIGLGVGIDYALFLITRHRQQVMDGRDPVTAAARATSTSGRAVLVSGCTVIIALAGLYVSRVAFIGKLGVAAAVTVVTAVLGALTLVPALLGWIGPHIDRFTLRRAVAEEPEQPDGAEPAVPTDGLARYAQRVADHPWWFLAAGLVVVGVLAIPVFSIRLDHIDDGADPTSFTDRRAFDLISTGFGPGTNGPLTIVVDQSTVATSDRQALAGKVQQALTGVPGAASISAPQPTSDGDLLVATAVPVGRPQNASTTSLFNLLRTQVLPQAVAGTPAKTYITGTTAAQLDFVELMTSRLPGIIAVVVGLAFLVILTVFRGLLVAVKAAVLNLLSIAASYGVVVAVFYWGWGGPALGVSGNVPIESYVPMIMFAIVFGLSMDYEVFLLSRVHEFWLRTHNEHDSVAHGLRITARVISCAALIMISVFAAFLLSHTIVVKMLGLGLAVSVLIDATVVRLLMVPAVMVLLGRHAWWIPRWLDRLLPHIDPEGAEADRPSENHG
ncbi:MMPL family transporter [Kitasatospora acidiphila]|uniref:MMPL family transporter n=1 Tax=Kitasatospora acidiphila TaxID=2567942 RepID=A0A540WCN6_9ACTN|nr:MMPL family transporter [Kitasatospora acidiphila]TQF06722.1 MMPL family transporter [Kitasatospora acidiphila]